MDSRKQQLNASQGVAFLNVILFYYTLCLRQNQCVLISPYIDLESYPNNDE